MVLVSMVMMLWYKMRGIHYVDLKWKAGADGGKYAIFRSANGYPFQQIAIISGTTYLDFKLLTKTTYSYYIETSLGGVLSNPSNRVTVTTR
jgi:hypothetical protein